MRFGFSDCASVTTQMPLLSNKVSTAGASTTSNLPPNEIGGQAMGGIKQDGGMGPLQQKPKEIRLDGKTIIIAGLVIVAIYLLVKKGKA